MVVQDVSPEQLDIRRQEAEDPNPDFTQKQLRPVLEKVEHAIQILNVNAIIKMVLKTNPWPGKQQQQQQQHQQQQLLTTAVCRCSMISSSGQP